MFEPFRTEVSYFEDRAAGLLSMKRSGLPNALSQIRSSHPRFAGLADSEILAADFTDDDARLVTAREHGFETWPAFESAIAASAEQSPTPFRAAFLALESEDDARFDDLLTEHSELAAALGTNGNTLLSLALSCRRLRAVERLLAGGADVNGANVRGWTPLHQAAYAGWAEAIELLLRAEAHVECSAHGDGGTPLAAALFWGHRDAADLLAPAGIFPLNLRIAASAGRHDLAARMLPGGDLAAKAGLHRAFYRPHSGFPEWTPSDDPQEILDEAFVWSAKNGRLESMDLLLQHGARIDGDPYRGTALAWVAANSRDLATATWLLDRGAPVNQRATFGGPGHGQGITALHLTAANGAVEMVRLLLSRGADPGMKDDLYQSTAAGWAEYGGHLDTARFIEGWGAQGRGV